MLGSIPISRYTVIPNSYQLCCIPSRHIRQPNPYNSTSISMLFKPSLNRVNVRKGGHPPGWGQLWHAHVFLTRSTNNLDPSLLLGRKTGDWHWQPAAIVTKESIIARTGVNISLHAERESNEVAGTPISFSWTPSTRLQANYPCRTRTGQGGSQRSPPSQ